MNSQNKKWQEICFCQIQWGICTFRIQHYLTKMTKICLKDDKTIAKLQFDRFKASRNIIYIKQNSSLVKGK